MTKLSETISTEADSNKNSEIKRAKTEVNHQEAFYSENNHISQINVLLDDKKEASADNSVLLWSPLKTNIGQNTKLVEFQHLIETKYRVKLGKEN